MPIRFRETRLDEIEDAVRFAQASDEALDARSVRHDLSHTALHGGQVIGSAVMCLDADAQQAVIVHVGSSVEPEASESETNGEDGPAAPDAAATVNQEESLSPDAAPPAAEALVAPAVLGRQLLDLTLMKLRNDGECTTRLRAAPGLAEQLWAEAGWLDRLPDLAPPAGDSAWLDRLDDAHPDAVEVVRGAWDRANEALESVRAAVIDVPPADERETSENDGVVTEEDAAQPGDAAPAAAPSTDSAA